MDRPIVNISEGKIQGIKLKSVLGSEYFAFKGIPYAQPPIGPLRFKEPQAPVKWPGILDVSKHASDIPMQNQTDHTKPDGVLGSEDCLYLNVYTNALNEKKRPVMFYIYGGGFVEGTGNDVMYGEDYFVTTDVILVTINYRLGPFGFLNLGHEVASGNQGLKDIIFALKWTQRNIEAFGGDPDNVTIFGNSAGSMICHLFTLLPNLKGLFHKAILLSGTLFMMKSLKANYDFKNGFKIASLLGMNSDNAMEVIEFLRTVPAEKLIELETKILSERERRVLNMAEYAPIFDGNFTKDPVIPLPIKDLLKNDTDIPIVVGDTVHESLLFLAGNYTDENYKYYDNNIEEMVENMLMLKDPSQFSEIMKLIREFYLKNKPINRETIWNLIHLLSNLSFINNNRKLIDLRNEYANAPTYYYRFSFLGNEISFYQYDYGRQPLNGVAHADELAYMFYLSYMRKEGEHPLEGTKERIVLERFLKMWYNFAATGNPTPSVDERYITTVWKPSSKEHLYYLDINEELTLRNDKDSEDRAIYEKYKNLI